MVKFIKIIIIIILINIDPDKIILYEENLYTYSFFK